MNSQTDTSINSKHGNVPATVIPKKKKRKEIAIFGNYRNYYGYRTGQGSEDDPRVKSFRIEWFKGKDCLDIGCNNGSITITIAQKFFCRSILGIDIDGDRIADAYWNLRKAVKMNNASKMPPKTSKPEEDAKGVNGSQHSDMLCEENTNKISGGDSTPSQGRDLFEVVSFEKGNFVQNWQQPEDKCYDVITCLSVSKWIHLNWGDDGLITLFTKIWRLLQPGGIFILEPQPWSSYYKNHLVSETASNNYRNIKIFPRDFQDILLDKIGFRKVENITFQSPGSKSGFDRPLFAFWK